MLDRSDPRWGDESRDRDSDARDLGRAGTDPREREQVDPRDVFMDHVDLPRGLDREHVHTRDYDYTLRRSETRTLATVGAFRVVPATDLRDRFDESLDPRQGELWHLRESGLVHTVQLDRRHANQGGAGFARVQAPGWRCTGPVRPSTTVFTSRGN